MDKTSKKIMKREKPNDVFLTPISLVETHINFVKALISDGDTILDPFYGTGNYYNTLIKVFDKCIIDWTEIEKERDFFEYEKKVDVIISNPPYSILDKVFEKSVELKPRVISYLIGIHNLTTRRIEIMNKSGYYLHSCKMLKVYKWFGMSCITTFVKGNDKNCIDFDRIVYR